MAEHKNYIEAFDGNRDSFVEQYVIKNKSVIFGLLSKKIQADGENDILNHKPKIWNIWLYISNIAADIHGMLSIIWSEDTNSKIWRIVEDMINMDYGTVSLVFMKISKRFEKLGFNEESLKVKQISELFWIMRKKSKKYTRIIER